MPWLSDIEIAQNCTMHPIGEIAQKAHVDDKYLEQYGRYKAKVDLSFLADSPRKEGKLVLVTAITPTPPGRARPPPPSAWPTACATSARKPWWPCVSPPWVRYSG